MIPLEGPPMTETIESCQERNDYTRSQCTRAAGHPGVCEDAMGYRFGTSSRKGPDRETPTPARVTFSADGRAIYVSDAEPEESALVRIARDVHQHSAEMLRSGLTEPELRFVAKTLRQSLGDILDLFAPDPLTEVSTTAGEAGRD